LKGNQKEKKREENRKKKNNEEKKRRKRQVDKSLRLLAVQKNYTLEMRKQV